MTTATETTVEHGPAKRVWLYNDGADVFHQEVHGTEINLEPGQRIEVARRTAVEAKGMYLGRNVKVSLRWEPIPEKGFEEEAPVGAAAKVYACPNCDFECTVKEDLKEHMQSHKRGPKPKE